jgi:hypothetical protein
MTNREDYKNYQILTTPNWNNEISGFSFLVTVYDLKPKSENDFIFTEKSQISNFAIKVKYGDNTDIPAKEIIEKTIAKVKTRIDFGLFDKGNEYFQSITTDNLEEGFIPIDDELIQDYLLKGLLNLRKSNPQSFIISNFNPIGFCEILKISFNSYIFIADLLMEDGYIETKIDNGIEEGQIYITSKGVTLISEKKKRDEFKKTSSTLEHSKKDDQKFDVAISFAGEDRELAEKIATILKEKQVSVFYDSFEKADIWGKNLYDYLSSVYGEKSKYCVMLLSEHYEKKLWTNFERKSAQARAFRENREYILPIKIDNTKITGIHETVGYLDIKSHTIDEIVELIMIKLSRI